MGYFCSKIKFIIYYENVIIYGKTTEIEFWNNSKCKQTLNRTAKILFSLHYGKRFRFIIPLAWNDNTINKLRLS